MHTPFGALALCSELQRGLADLGLPVAPALLARAVPGAVKGQDLILLADAGRDRTLAHVLPALQRLRRDGRAPKVLVVVTTPAQAREVSRMVEQVGRHMAVTCEVAGPEASRPSDVLVGPPDLLRERLDAGDLDLSGVSAFAIDGLDDALAAGFEEDLHALLEAAPSRRQTVLAMRRESAATRAFGRYVRDPRLVDDAEAETEAEPEIAPATEAAPARRSRGRRAAAPVAVAPVEAEVEAEDEPIEVLDVEDTTEDASAEPREGGRRRRRRRGRGGRDREAGASQAPVESVPAAARVAPEAAPPREAAGPERHLYQVVGSEEARFDALLELLRGEDPDRVLLFARTRTETKDLSGRLRELGFAAGRLNGDMTPSQKNRTVEAFRSGEIRILAATDAADRDLGDVSHVVHVAVPPTLQHYQRRSKGAPRVITVVGPEEAGAYAAMQRAYAVEPLGEALPEPPSRGRDGRRQPDGERRDGREGRDGGRRDRRDRRDRPDRHALPRRHDVPAAGSAWEDPFAEEAEAPRRSILNNSVVDSLPPLTATPRRRRGKDSGVRIASAGAPSRSLTGSQVQLAINLGMVNQFASSELADLLAARTGRPVSLGAVQVQAERTLFNVPEAEASRIIGALNRTRDDARGVELRVETAGR